MKNPRIAVLQPYIKNGSRNRNLNKALDMIDEVGKEADFILLPEDFLTLFDYRKAKVETIPGEVTNLLSDRAKKYKNIIISAFAEKKAGKYFVSAPVIGPRGILGVYRKIHNYRPFDKIPGIGRRFSAGGYLKIFDSKFCKFGVQICWDIFYPDQFKKLALKGAKIIFVPAFEWGPETFRSIALSRATENVVFVALSNPWRDSKRSGSSCIASPFHCFKAPDKESILVKKVNLDILKEIESKEQIRYEWKK